MEGSERRRHERVEPLDLFYVQVDEQGRHILETEGRVLNVSETGICLGTSVYHEPGQNMLLSLAFGEVLVEVQCRVAHCRTGKDTGFETGVAVLDTEGAFGDIVRNFIAHFRNQYGS